MATFRTIKESGNFVTVHKNFIHDNNITFKAKGILLYLLSRPDDWQIYESEILKHTNDGKDSLKSGIRELEKIGYVERIRKRDDKGHLNGYEYLVYEHPVQNGKSYVGKSNNGIIILLIMTVVVNSSRRLIFTKKTGLEYLNHL